MEKYGTVINKFPKVKELYKMKRNGKKISSIFPYVNKILFL